MNNSNFPIGIHSDILNADPVNIEDKQRLVEEIKNRAKSILGATKNYSEALQLYNKAILVLGNDATLYGNRSMCYLSMKNNRAALEDANKAIELDANYAKGYYRKAMAELELGQYLDSYNSLQENLKLAPNDKSITQQITKVTQLLDKARENGENYNNNKNNNNNNNNNNNTVPKARNTITTNSTSPIENNEKDEKNKNNNNNNNNNKTKAETVEKVIEEETIDSKSNDTNAMRGYKITADGKKTSYFTNVLDDKTKELIGDIRPKKIEVPIESTLNNNTNNNTISSSVWNSAGTFEEKIVTPWAKEYLQTCLETIDLHIPNVFPHPSTLPTSTNTTNDIPLSLLDIFINITKVKSVNGDASTVYNRGKKKYLYDINSECEWKFEAYVHTDITNGRPTDITPVLSANGKVNIIDITADDECELSYEISNTKNNSKTINKKEFDGLINKYIKSSGIYSDKIGFIDKLEIAIKKQIKQFDKEFKSKY